MNFEIVNAEVVGAARSGAYLLFTFLGGATFFFGPILGAVLMVLAFVMFSEITKAWLLYLGAVFMLMVMYAPGGLASLIMLNLQVVRHGKLRSLLPVYGLLAFSGAVCAAGFSALIEMVYHRQLDAAMGPVLQFLGMALDTSSVAHWIGLLVYLAIGVFLFEFARRRFALQWSVVHQSMEDERLRAAALP